MATVASRSGERHRLPTAPARTLAGWFVLVYLIGLIYGTLYPWTGWRGIGLSGFDFLRQPWPRYWTAFDLLTNIGLYAPLGALLGWFVRHHAGPRLALTLPVGVALCVSGSLEALQTFLPGRTPSNVDLLCNVVGAALGAGIALSVWSTSWREQSLHFRPHTKVTVALLGVWLALQALPQRLPFESGLLLGPLLGWLDQIALAIDSAEDSIPRVLASTLAQALAPLQNELSRLNAYRDIVEAGAASAWLACIGIMLTNILAPSIRRPLAIGALLGLGLLIHLASDWWLRSNTGWSYWLSPGSQGGAALGVLCLSLLTLLRRPHRLAALFALLIVAVTLTNLLPAGGYEQVSATIRPGWRNLFGLLEALALLWPLAALIATAAEWRMLKASARNAGRPL